MFDFIPDSWRQALGHLHEAIHHSLDRWLHDERSEPEARPGALVPRPAAEVVRRDASRLPLLFADRGPVVDIDETDDDLIVSAELPGLECDDFRVEVSGERLVIRGEKKQTSERQERGFTYTERRYDAFARAIPLPCEVDTDKVIARYKDGVLRITLPKTEQAKSRRVTIKVNG
jgi:HSP20 family protein